MRTLTAVAALALTTGLSGLLAGCGDDTEPTSSETGSDTPTSAATAEPTSEPATPTETDPATETDEAAPSGTAPIYFTGSTPLGTRLYREFREVEADNPLEEAAALLVAGDTADPDYGTLLQGVVVDAVEQEPDAIVVTLGDDSAVAPDKGMSPDDAALAVQSLVYTLQGVAQERLPVRVQLSDGSPADLFDQPTGAGVEAAPELDVLALVSLTTPEEGATYAAGDTLTVDGRASSFEATVPVVLLDADGQPALDTFATAEGWMDRLYPYSVDLTLDVAPGTYTVVARTDDPSDGEGPGPFEDTRTIVVE